MKRTVLLPLPFIAMLSKMSSNDRDLVLSALDRIATMTKNAVGNQCAVADKTVTENDSMAEANLGIAEQNSLIAENNHRRDNRTLLSLVIKDIVLGVINSSTPRLGQVHPPTAETVTTSDNVQPTPNRSVVEQERNTWGLHPSHH